MMEFKLGDRTVKLKWNKILRETPQVFDKPLNDDYIDEKLRQPIADAFNSNGIYPTDDKEIFHIPKLVGGLFLYVVEGNFVGAVNFDYTYLDGESYFVPTLAKKFETDYSGVLHKIYKFVGNKYKTGIVSDETQSRDSSSIWKKWFLNPEKYDIKEIYTIPRGMTNVDDVWNSSDKYKDVRVVVKFKS